MIVPPAEELRPTPVVNADDGSVVPTRWISQRAQMLNIRRSHGDERPIIEVAPREIARKLTFRKATADAAAAAAAVENSANVLAAATAVAAANAAHRAATAEANKPRSIGDIKRDIVRLGGRTDDCVERSDLEARLSSLHNEKTQPATV